MVKQLAGPLIARPEIPPRPVIVIRPTRGWRALDLREVWAYRELVYFLVWRNIKVRYKQTAIGAAWAVLQPLLLMLVSTIFFSKLAKIPSDGVPYPVFAYAGLLPWQLFSKAMTESATSVMADQRLITKVYFPRIIVPLASTLAGLIDFAIASVLLVVLMLAYGIVPGVAAVLLPLCVLLLMMTAMGTGFWLSALNAEYRDVAYTLPFLSQFWLFVTPVVYPSSIIPEPWRTLSGLNPMAGVVEGFRWALLGTGTAPWGVMATSAVVALVLFVSGVAWFRRCERTFVDVIGGG